MYRHHLNVGMADVSKILSSIDVARQGTSVVMGLETAASAVL